MSSAVYEEILTRPNALAIMDSCFRIYVGEKTTPSRSYNIFGEMFSYGDIKYIASKFAKMGNLSVSDYNLFKKINRERAARYLVDGEVNMQALFDSFTAFCNGRLNDKIICLAQKYIEKYATLEEENQYHEALKKYIEPVFQKLCNYGWTERTYLTRVKIFGSYSSVSYSSMMYCLDDYLLLTFDMNTEQYFAAYGKPKAKVEKVCVPRPGANAPCVEVEVLNKIANLLRYGVEVDGEANRPFDMIDFCLLTGSQLNLLILRKSIGLMGERQDQELINQYFKKIPITFIANPESLMNQQYIMINKEKNQVTITDEQKQKAVDLINDLGLPMLSQVYIAVLRRMVKEYPLPKIDNPQYVMIQSENN